MSARPALSSFIRVYPRQSVALLFIAWPHFLESDLRHSLESANVELMKFVTSITRDEDGMWIVECPEIPGCVSQGSTRAEALENAREAIEACLEVRAGRGMPGPDGSAILLS